MSRNHEQHGGVSAILMNNSIDTGDIVAQHRFSLRGDETSQQIRSLTFEHSWRLFDLVLPTLVARDFDAIPQDLTQRTYFGDPTSEIGGGE